LPTRQTVTSILSPITIVSFVLRLRTSITSPSLKTVSSMLRLLPTAQDTKHSRTQEDYGAEKSAREVQERDCRHEAVETRWARQCPTYTSTQLADRGRKVHDVGTARGILQVAGKTVNASSARLDGTRKSRAPAPLRCRSDEPSCRFVTPDASSWKREMCLRSGFSPCRRRITYVVSCCGEPFAICSQSRQTSAEKTPICPCVPSLRRCFVFLCRFPVV
jgi:hypothetical protein